MISVSLTLAEPLSEAAVAHFTPLGIFLSVDAGVPTAHFDDSMDPATVKADVESFDPLPDTKSVAKAFIDDAAGRARARYITTVQGQEATYLLKRDAAKAYQAAGYTGAVPEMIKLEADAVGKTYQVLADEILAQSAAWESLAAMIESLRMVAKAAIDAETSVIGIKQTAKSFESQMDGI